MSGVGSQSEVFLPARHVRCTLDFVAKVFLGCRTKILRATDAFYARRREGPYRCVRNRPRTFVPALNSEEAAEKHKNRLSREFWGCSIFNFCNNICHKPTCAADAVDFSLHASACNLGA